MENWDWALSSEASFKKYFKPHFDILKDCGTTTDAGCFHGANEMKLLNGTKDSTDYNIAACYRFITSDGIAYNYTADSGVYPSRTAHFYADVNGKKGPNTIGRDVFTFSVYRKAGIKPNGSLLRDDETQAYSSYDTDNSATYGCNVLRSGWNCAAKVLSEGAMNY